MQHDQSQPRQAQPPSAVVARQPAIFLPHGGGPCFFMDWPAGGNPWERLGDWLRGLSTTLPGRPRAILVVSGHWEAPQFTVNAGTAPELLYDYHGFPEHTYRLSYPAPGDPRLAGRVRELIAAAGLPGATESARGFDHGVFVPFLLVDPQASIPVVQLSLQKGMDPERHIALGRALAGLRDEGVLVVGSGMSYHNLRGFGPAFAAPSRRFDDWLTTAATHADPAQRDAALAAWEQAPHARTCHPREEHLLPLMVVAGAGGDDRGVKVFEDRVMDTTLSAFRFG
ncbi:MAG: dioxygenase [Burkholderiaceae bacterium]|nr:dioxygenase [Burkholderiaceae bacterium]